MSQESITSKLQYARRLPDMPGSKHLGFTGSKRPLTLPQKEAIQRTLMNLCEQHNFTHLHHGDCISADAFAHAIWHDYLGLPIILHPPLDLKYRAFCLGSSTTRDPKPYLIRNREIVSEVEALVAAPRRMSEDRRSGTWATVRYARAKKIPIRFCWPSGSTTTEGE